MVPAPDAERGRRLAVAAQRSSNPAAEARGIFRNGGASLSTLAN